MNCPTKDLVGMCPRCKEWTGVCEPCCPMATVEDMQTGKTTNDCTCQGDGEAA
jgi:hypothetical protein